MSRNEEIQLTLITPPAVEAISLQEAKKYLHRDDSDGMCNGLDVKQSIPPGNFTQQTVTGESIEVLGYAVTVELSVGESDGGLSVYIEDSNDGAAWETFHTFSETVGNRTVSYTGDKRYIRVVAVIEDAASLSAFVILEQGFFEEDAYISALITTAREYCEGFQNRAYITQTWEMSLPCFWLEIEVPKGKLQNIDSILYKDSTGAETEIDSSQYVYSTRGIHGRIKPAYSVTWPSFTPYPLDPVIIRFTCGYGGPEDVPQKVKQAMLLLISHWYENRTPLAYTNTIPRQVGLTVDALLWQDRIVPV